MSNRSPTVAPWPQGLRSSRDWRGLSLWSDWPTTAADTFYEPESSEEDLSECSYLLTTVGVHFAVDADAMPDPDLGAIEQSAHAAVAILVEQLNRVVTPILQQLEQS